MEPAESSRPRTIPQNRLIQALDPAEQHALAMHLQDVHLRAGAVLCRPGELMPYVYFPYQAQVSLLVLMDDGAAIEGAIVGNQGMIGLPVFLGQATSTEEVAVQVGGLAGRVPASTFREIVSERQPLKQLLYRYALAFLQDLSRAAACNAMHSVRQRCARRLLVSRDLAGSCTFPLTHEALAHLLGVRRASVSQSAEALREARIIDYQRGWIEIIDARALADEACEDYEALRAVYARISN